MSPRGQHNFAVELARGLAFGRPRLLTAALCLIAGAGMPFELEPYHRNVADEDLIADLRRVRRTLAAATVSWEQYERLGSMARGLFAGVLAGGILLWSERASPSGSATRFLMPSSSRISLTSGRISDVSHDARKRNTHPRVSARPRINGDSELGDRRSLLSWRSRMRTIHRGARRTDRLSRDRSDRPRGKPHCGFVSRSCGATASRAGIVARPLPQQQGWNSMSIMSSLGLPAAKQLSRTSRRSAPDAILGSPT